MIIDTDREAIYCEHCRQWVDALMLTEEEGGNIKCMFCQEVLCSNDEHERIFGLENN